MARVQSGDEAAFADLYDLTHVRVGSIIARTLRAPEHSAEVMQEVFLYAWQNAQSYDPARGTIITWLAVLARGRAIDRVRAVTRSVARDHRHIDLDQDVVPDVADLGIALHEAAQLRDAVQRLDAKQREAVELTHLGGYTQQEAAILLSVPLGTLKTRVRAGLASLRANLQALPI